MDGKTEPRAGTLYVVATPIGSLRDITLRALDVLRDVDLIVAEDTRVTRALLSAHGIGNTVAPVHLRDERRAADVVIRALSENKSVALVSDAGTPAVSDPGAALVAQVRDAGFSVTPVPGPSAVAALLSVAGMALPRWLFVGYLPAKPADRRRELKALAAEACGLVFYEAPHRIVECADDLAEILGGERRVCVGRELTKRFETLHSCTLAILPDWLRADADRQRGEFALVCEGTRETGAQIEAGRVVDALAAELPPAQAARLAARITGAPRDELYARARKAGPKT